MRKQIMLLLNFSITSLLHINQPRIWSPVTNTLTHISYVLHPCKSSPESLYTTHWDHDHGGLGDLELFFLPWKNGRGMAYLHCYLLLFSSLSTCSCFIPISTLIFLLFFLSFNLCLCLCLYLCSIVSQIPPWPRIRRAVHVLLGLLWGSWVRVLCREATMPSAGCLAAASS